MAATAAGNDRMSLIDSVHALLRPKYVYIGMPIRDKDVNSNPMNYAYDHPFAEPYLRAWNGFFGELLRTR